ncbi:MAG: ribosome maturation factor RimM [Gammaproteobacteria bacterium]
MSKPPDNGPASREVTVGRIEGVFGVRGWVKVVSFTEPRTNILDYDPWYVQLGERRSVRRLIDGRQRGKKIVARLEGIDDRDAAAGLLGAQVQVDVAQFADLEEGEYYWAQLIGLRVVNRHGVELGVVEDLMETGANDVLVLGGEQERLIPFVSGRVIESVDIDAGVIYVDWEADF